MTLIPKVRSQQNPSAVSFWTLYFFVLVVGGWYLHDKSRQYTGIVASKSIPLFTVLTPIDSQRATWDYKPEGYIADVQDLKDRILVSTVSESDPITNRNSVKLQKWAVGIPVVVRLNPKNVVWLSAVPASGKVLRFWGLPKTLDVAKPPPKPTPICLGQLLYWDPQINSSLVLLLPSSQWTKVYKWHQTGQLVVQTF